MKLIQLTCPNCHANLEVDSEQKEFTCKYCRTTTIIDEEIIKVEHTIIDNAVAEKIKVANTYLFDFEDYEKAYSTFQKLSEEYPYEPEVWWGLILSETKNFQDYSDNYWEAPDFSLCDEYFDKYLRVEKDNVRKEEHSEKYKTYVEKTNSVIENNDISEETSSAILKIGLFVLGIILVTFMLLGMAFN